MRRNWIPNWFKGALALACAALFTVAADDAMSQLVDQTQITPNPAVPGSVIAKSLSQQVGTGQGGVFTEGSSIYPSQPSRKGHQEGTHQRDNNDEDGEMIPHHFLISRISFSSSVLYRL